MTDAPSPWYRFPLPVPDSGSCHRLAPALSWFL